ncbi:MAG: bifunctional [glutamine synthetase] adenylyltransferase/[glutamine synthetase]-adenylyl-L-tyrosine phosphorylase [Propylenella sp.]
MPPEALRRRIAALPESPHGPAALAALSDAARRQETEHARDALLADGDAVRFLASALGDCPFLLDLAVKDIRRLTAILDTAPEDRVAAVADALESAEWPTRPEAMAALRIARQDVALTVGLADLAGATSLEATIALLTRFADAALGAALRFALAEAARAGKWAGGGEPRGFFILGMGKLGAAELNYSSDIDLIALFDPNADGLAPGVEPLDFWVRIVRRIVTLLQERTGDGYVFRVDLRLRPDPGSTLVAIAIPAALLYYEGTGQNWERAALIKARPVAADAAAGKAFLGELVPFVWRKYLDYAAIADIHSIKRQVQSHRGHATVRVPGHDIKRGRGGIREIEFFVQTQQLIAGGRDPALRGTKTRAMLKELEARGWIDQGARDELDEAYVFLRTVEHRLQMVRDEQTHAMPRDREELARIGRLIRMPDAGEFEARLRSVLETVARRYSELFEGAAELSAEAGSLVFTGTEDDPETLKTLRSLGFEAPESVTEIVRGWHFGRVQAMRSAAARESLTEITPALLQALSRAGNPDAAVRAFDSLLRALPAGAQLFALLRNNPDLLDLLATILSAAPKLAEVFARRPHVAGALLDPAAAAMAAGRKEVQAGLDRSLAEARSFEEALDRVRLFVAERRFLISVGLLNGALEPQDAGRAFSDLAEAVVRALLEKTETEFARRHGRVPGGRTAIVALGRLGSREMTAGSDLDLLVVYDHAPDAGASDGKRPLPPSQYYIRLTQRLIAALAAPTAEGIAYAVDLRLRPSGRAGPLATHIEAFEHYQQNEAWTWEHMAVSRGRAIAGDSGLMERVSGVIDAVVEKPREREALAADVASMRARIEREKGAEGVFDVKLASGGLMDLEFAAQFLVLSGLGRVAGETMPETLARAEGEGRLDPEDAERLLLSASLQVALLQLQRVAGAEAFAPDKAPEALKRLVVAAADRALANAGVGQERAGIESFEELDARLGQIQQQTRAALERVLGCRIE